MSAREPGEWRIVDVSEGWRQYSLFVGWNGEEYQAGECYDCEGELIRYEHDGDAAYRRCVACGSKDCGSSPVTDPRELTLAIARTVFAQPHHSVDPIAVEAQSTPA